MDASGGGTLWHCTQLLSLPSQTPSPNPLEFPSLDLATLLTSPTVGVSDSVCLDTGECCINLQRVYKYYLLEWNASICLSMGTIL